VDQSLEINAGGATDIGPVRRLNEDSIFAKHPVYVVADGMGGHDAGEVASDLTIQCLGVLAGAREVTLEHVRRAVALAQDEVSNLDSDAGSTVTGVVAVSSENGCPNWVVLNIGDSRTYRVYGGAIERLTEDNSEVEELLRAGLLSPEEAQTYPRKNVITRAVGDGVSLGDFSITPVTPGERLVICSDGLCGVLDDSEILAEAQLAINPTDAGINLVNAAIRAGTRDNVTALIVDSGPFLPNIEAQMPEVTPVSR